MPTTGSSNMPTGVDPLLNPATDSLNPNTMSNDPTYNHGTVHKLVNDAVYAIEEQVVGKTNIVNYRGAWSSIATYQPGDAVLSNSAQYICLATNQNEPPPNSSYWDQQTPITGSYPTEAQFSSLSSQVSTNTTNISTNTSSITSLQSQFNGLIKTSGVYIGNAPNANSNIFIQGGDFVGTTNSVGAFNIFFPVPFPNGLITCVVTNGDDSVAAGWNLLHVNSTLNYAAVQWWNLKTGSIFSTGTLIRCSWIALGW